DRFHRDASLTIGSASFLHLHRSEVSWPRLERPLDSFCRADLAEPPLHGTARAGVSSTGNSFGSSQDPTAANPLHVTTHHTHQFAHPEPARPAAVRAAGRREHPVLEVISLLRARHAR